MNARSDAELQALIASTEHEIARLNDERVRLSALLDELRAERVAMTARTSQGNTVVGAPFFGPATPEAKLALFRSLFYGRQDIYARRWESQKTGRSGYQPACANEWVRGVCEKPRIKCADCAHRVLLPLADEVIRNHLRGQDPRERDGAGRTRDYTVGVYPLLSDETCRFLAVDFDKAAWQQDSAAFLATCTEHLVPAALERSRSGNGGHVWIFFAEAVPATLARKLGSFLLTRTMERRPEIGLDSYDRFFPCQDTMPTGGFGNLIALPLQRKPREHGNSLFVDEEFIPYSDQIAFLSSLRPMKMAEVSDLVGAALRSGELMGVRMVATEDDDEEPWSAPPSRQRPIPVIAGVLPADVSIVLGNQLYIEKAGLTAPLVNRLVRLAAFQNPEFYKAQAMRLPTFGKPRVIACAEDYPQHWGLPRGCLEEVLDLFRTLGVPVRLIDERVDGSPLEVEFAGILRPDQEEAARRILAHETGVLAATTAFGKTVVAAYVIAQRAVSTLVLVHRQQLTDQWVERINCFLGLERKQIGQVGGGKHRPTGCVDVALMQSLVRKGAVDDVVGQYGHLVVDECHHISAQSFEQVARRCKARYVTGLSATVVRKDGHHPIIFMQCGPVRYHVSARTQAAQRPFDHRVVVRPTSWKPTLADGASPAIQELYGAMGADADRNALILRDVRDAVCAGRSPVVLTERREHLQLLADQLTPVVRHVVILRGGMGAKQRREVADRLAGIPDGEERVLISTGRYLGEGFDDARLDTLFLTMPISWRGTLAQYAGRLHRLHEQKTEVIIYDYADLGVEMLARMHDRRLKGYGAIGYAIDTGNCANPLPSDCEESD